ncbi:maleate cis-trans isomerase family protein [Devosia sp.]|uniref:maleate cis-trans isomerase family protein n=1 Tax=Devosia sp. TaxID=1871048 RepID=UPI003BAA7E24
MTRIRIGMITPSSNTSLEPMTALLLAGAPEITAHYARIRVTEITIGAKGLAQFDAAPMLEAASLLADMRPQAIVWNGTSGGWRGLEADRQLCAALEERTGIATTTMTLALVDLLRKKQMQRIAFVTPYTGDVQARILDTFTREGFVCSTSPCLGISENFAFATVPSAAMNRMVANAAADRPDVILPFCTNLAATPYAAAWEAQFGIPVYDSIAMAARAGIELSGGSPAAITGFGSVFE